MTNDFEMAYSDNPEDVIMATQKSLIRGLREIFRSVSEDTKAPGLTWEQLDHALELFGNKKPTIIIKTGLENEQ